MLALGMKLDLFSFNLSIIYLTSITHVQKAQRTYICILEGADVGVLWSYVVEETGEPGENHLPWTGEHDPAILAHLSRRLIGELIVYQWSGVRPSVVRSQCSNIFFSETA